MYSPTHLSLFALARGMGQPIAGLPFYAEVVTPVAVVPPAVPIDGRFNDLIDRALSQLASATAPDEQSRRRVIAATAEAMSRILSDAGRDTLESSSAAQKDSFFDAVLRDVGEAGAGAAKTLSDAALRALVEKAVRAAAARQGLALAAEPDLPAVKARTAYPLGTLATNHMGYLSFDLTRLPPAVYQSLLQAVDLRRNDGAAELDVSVWLYALAREELRFDGLDQGRFAQDAIVTKLELDLPTPLPPIFKAAGLASMQNPSLTDWRLSSASFAASPSALLGDDAGCENLLPAHVALQDYKLYQVVQLSDAADAVPANLRAQVQLGVVHEYRVAWYPLGHSLGQITYSLPLAPGESVNLAVIDWTRRDDAQRKEHTTLDEQLVHQEHRDRSISETVNAAVQEYQHGSSFMAGVAGSAGASGSSGALGGAIGLAGSLGGSTASSSGSRNIAASTVQNVSDNITQASAAMRELQSTVVVHSTQSEKEAIETRTIVNYNHSHALTILYYEVLRHFRVVTELVRRRPAVLVKLRTDWFDGAAATQRILENRAALQAALLEPKFADAFDAMERLRGRGSPLSDFTKPLPAPGPAPAPPARPGFSYFEFEMTTGGFSRSIDDHANAIVVRSTLLRTTGPLVELVNLDGNPPLNNFGAFSEPFKTNIFVAVPQGGVQVQWDDITAIALLVEVTPEDDDTAKVSFSHVKVTALDTVTGRPGVVILDQGYENGHLIVTNRNDEAGRRRVLPTLRPPAPPPAPPPFAAGDMADHDKAAALLAHLLFHKSYYSRAILFAQNATDRSIDLALIKFADGTSVLNRLENRPLELIGDLVAYPSTDQGWSDAVAAQLARTPEAVEPDADPADERLVTLPTRGVFAEAKLGHCNASEEIDNSRFWDWQASPIPHLAPEIAPIQGVTPQPQTQNLTPTAFPTSLVNIVNPPAAPDPTGLASALTALATPNIFRDMSGQAQVEDLLKRLSDNSISIAEASNVARGLQGKSGGGGGGGSGGPTQSSGGGAAPGFNGPRANPTQPSAVNGDLRDLQKVLDTGQQGGFVTPQAAQRIFTNAANTAYGVDDAVPTTGGANDRGYFVIFGLRTSGASQFFNAPLGLNPLGAFNNAVEISAKNTLAPEEPPRHSRFRWRQTVSQTGFEKIGAAWQQVFHSVGSASDDPLPQFQAYDPVRAWFRMYDSPGWPSPAVSEATRLLDLGGGKTNSAQATEVVVKMALLAWVEGLNAGGAWERISTDVLDWCSVQWLKRATPTANWTTTPGTKLLSGTEATREFSKAPDDIDL